MFTTWIQILRNIVASHLLSNRTWIQDNTCHITITSDISLLFTWIFLASHLLSNRTWIQDSTCHITITSDISLLFTWIFLRFSRLGSKLQSHNGQPHKLTLNYTRSHLIWRRFSINLINHFGKRLFRITIQWYFQMLLFNVDLY